ncbi:MAG: AAA family ATPase, partial [Deltaproteobacteria bacterium]|nr:AAA family ATPase [Deltaproteobacteria bacterium]
MGNSPSSLLRTGTSSFRKIRTERRLYVDKTMYLPELIDKGDVVFLSRPRRFGKSLTVSTLDSFFSGEKELFKGLAAEKFMDSPDFTPRPVINLVMSRPSGSDSKELLKEKIIEELRRNAERHGVS